MSKLLDTATIHIQNGPEIINPVRGEEGTNLVLLHPDGSEEVLFDAGPNGMVIDPSVTFDGQNVLFSYFPDMTSGPGNRPIGGADIYRINIITREVTRLTFQEWTPNTGGGPGLEWSSDPVNCNGKYCLGYGIFNLGPSELPDGRIIFTSSRNGLRSARDFTTLALQLYVMDADGENVEQVGFLNLGSALHPIALKDGRIMFSSYESQGIRDNRLWGIWAIWPDGRKWEPIFSAFTKNSGTAFHFHGQKSDGSLFMVEYYNQNNNGFGTLVQTPARPPAGIPPFGSVNPSENPGVQQGFIGGNPNFSRYPFEPRNLFTETPFAHPNDRSSDYINGMYMGKVTHPTGAPDNTIMLVWSPGPANHVNGLKNSCL